MKLVIVFKIDKLYFYGLDVYFLEWCIKILWNCFVLFFWLVIIKCLGKYYYYYFCEFLKCGWCIFKFERYNGRLVKKYIIFCYECGFDDKRVIVLSYFVEVNEENIGG